MTVAPEVVLDERQVGVRKLMTEAMGPQSLTQVDETLREQNKQTFEKLEAALAKVKISGKFIEMSRQLTVIKKKNMTEKYSQFKLKEKNRLDRPLCWENSLD